jgi:hypothetical protein
MAARKTVAQGRTFESCASAYSATSACPLSSIMDEDDKDGQSLYYHFFSCKSIPLFENENTIVIPSMFIHVIKRVLNWLESSIFKELSVLGIIRHLFEIRHLF